MPTYVDDAAGLTTGPVHTIMSCTLLLAAGHCAGLQADTHSCAWLEGPPVPAAARTVLAPFPMTFGHQGTSIHGLPPEFVCFLLDDAGLQQWTSRAVIVRRACHCFVKSAVVPSSGIDAWRQAMRFSPFGATSVQPHWR